ncbi:unnamed protein product [Allacma fusca]|uniref:PAP-associated domain-containing protein n=1 Tax=Allacma fusca TaxID=39272 RepID=A0A8J2KEI4_9HEXA|nr:unnamed protein product [Allacma fusca]
MHGTDGPSSYHNYQNQAHFSNHNRFPHGGYQPHNNAYHNPAYGHYGNFRNNNNHWRVYRNRFNYPRHNRHNNNHHHQQRQYHMQNQHRPMVHPGQLPDQTIIQLPVSAIDENSSHKFQPPMQASTPCAPDSSASSIKSETNSACSEHDDQPLPPTTHSHPKSTPPIPQNGFHPAPSVYSDSFDGYSRFVTLDDSIWKKFQINQQSLDVYRKKMDLWKELFDLFKATHAVNYPRYSLQVVGSTMSGFGSRRSDVDICLMIRRSEVDQRIEAVDRLHELQASLQKIPYMENIELIYAKVPILKFRDRSRNLDVDLNCNNSVGIRNTHLLYCYSQLDLFSSPYDVEKIKINEQIPKWDSHNQDSLGELLIGFLEYYARKFDYARAAVSVRLGCHVPIKLCMQTRSYKNDPHQWKYLCVEEPFDLTNTARSVYDKEAFDKIRGVFYASWQRLAYTRDLESIFHEIPEQESRAIAHRIGQNIFR